MAGDTRAESEQRRTELAWAPQPGPQTAYVRCPVFEVMFGGARGGGKTDGSLGDWAIHSARYGRWARGLLVRETYTALQDTLERSAEIFGPLGGVWHDKRGEWRMPGKGFLRLRHLKRASDAAHYQGHSYTRVYVEEMTQYASPAPINMLRGTARSAKIPSGAIGFRGTCNPGGPGHQWVRARYIDPAPGGWKVIPETFEWRGRELTLERVFIPSRLEHNPALIENDPLYVARLHQVGSENLVKAWLEGDWSIIDGAFFDSWSHRMILRPFEIPKSWRVFQSLDWGSARPFSVGWWAIVTDDYEHDGHILPRGALVRFAEWYGVRKSISGEIEPNVGLKMTAEQVSAGVLEREKRMGELKPAYRVADPSIFACDGGPSIAERMRPLYFQPADNKRVARDGHIGGWDQVRARMVGEDGNPMIYVFQTCADSIRTIPSLQHDEARPEDLDTASEDHAADEWRYACMSRPYAPALPAADVARKQRRYRSQPASTSNWMTA